MKAQLSMPLGNKTLTLEGEGDTKTIIKGFAFWSSLPLECGLCKSKNLSLNHRNHDGNEFYEMRCDSCTATIPFGQHKTGGTLFLKSAEGWSIYEGKKTNGKPKVESEPQEETVPF